MSAAPTNPLIDDRDVELILDEVLDLGRLLRLPHFADHDRETCELLLASTRELARGQLYPAYRALDAARGGAGLAALGAEIAVTCARARAAGVEAAWIAAVERAMSVIAGLTAELAGRGLAGSAEAMVLHATDYLDLFATAVVAWQWLDLAAIAHEALSGPLPRGRASRDAGYYRAKLAAAQYWIRTELPRIDHLAALCRDGEDSYLRLDPDWL